MQDSIERKSVQARVIAFYLPQYHPVEVNDKYWGPGFTEWRNVVKAKPLFRKHYQPKLPADLGFYDLRIPEVREKQAELAKEAGVEGFCYWHYWFGAGEEVLEMPLDEVVKTKKPDFPFCIGWANHSWKTSTWSKTKSSFQNTVIFEQKYLGTNDNEAHFYRLLAAFKDDRYIRVEGKLLFVIFDINGFKDFKQFKAQWNKLARENGIPEFYFVSHTSSIGTTDLRSIRSLEETAHQTINHSFDLGADGVDVVNMKYAEFCAKGRIKKIVVSILRRLKWMGYVEKYDFNDIVKGLIVDDINEDNIFPEIINGNDRSPRAGRQAIIYYNVTPEIFYKEAKKIINSVCHKDFDHRIVFLNSWNEWGEGMYMEPDLRYGKRFIEALNKALIE